MGYSYDFGYYGDEYIMEEMMAGFGFAFLGMLTVVLLVMLAIGIALYVLNSIGLYSIAKRRGIRNAWLAWIPVGDYWIEGSISDQYQYVVKGRQTNRRKILVIAGLVNMLAGSAMTVSRIALIINGGGELAFANGLLSGLAILASLTVGVALLVFHYIAMYDLYTSVSPQNNVLFLVLSIFFRITEPFFLFFSRRSDAGMPPRRAPEEPVVPPAAENVDFWSEN